MFIEALLVFTCSSGARHFVDFLAHSSVTEIFFSARFVNDLNFSVENFFIYFGQEANFYTTNGGKNSLRQ